MPINVFVNNTVLRINISNTKAYFMKLASSIHFTSSQLTAFSTSSTNNEIVLSKVLSRVLVIMDRFWNGFIAPYIFTTRDYRQYSAIADLHTLQFTVTPAFGFSVFTRRILATHL
jgi:hypothetical protein